jgi:hypothetical protein
MIETRGAKHAYVYVIMASKIEERTVGCVTTVSTARSYGNMFDVADSDDEAYGRAMRAAAIRYPTSAGWHNHHAAVVRISGLDWVGGHDFDKIDPLLDV